MTNAVKPAKMRLWIRLVLFVSLALNLLVLGVFVGAVSHGPDGGPWKHKTIDPVTPYMRALDDDQRKALRYRLRDSFVAKRKKDGKGALSGYQSALEILRQEPFDRDALLENLKQQSNANAERRVAGQTVLADFIANMSPADRAGFADQLEEELEEWRNRAWRKKSGHTPPRPKPKDHN